MSEPDARRPARLPPGGAEAERLAYDAIMHAVGKLEGKIDGMEQRLRNLENIANMGRGAWWAMLKLGAILTVISGLLLSVWDRIKIQ